MIVSNAPEKNHLSILAELGQRSDSVLFVSPFLFPDFEDFLDQVVGPKVKEVILVTTLKADARDMAYKCSSFVSMADYSSRRRLKLTIDIDNRLHGKVYLFKKSGSFVGGVLSSANLTENGMQRNHEWGVILEDPGDMERLEREILAGIEYPNLSEEKIIELMLETDKYYQMLNDQIVLENSHNRAVARILEHATSILTGTDMSYFVKPIGSIDDKVWDGDFSEEEEMYFSKRRPNSVKVGDILICYAVGPANLVSAFKVTSEPIHTGKKEDRWPWYVEAENLTPAFGKTWFAHNLHITTLAEEFLSTRKADAVTAVGGKTLGALQFGADKIKITGEFGRFLIASIQKTQVRQTG